MSNNNKERESARHWVEKFKKQETIKYLNKTKEQVFNQLMDEKLIKVFDFNGRYVNCFFHESSRKVAFIIDFILESTQPFSVVYQSSSKFHLRVSPTITTDLLMIQIKRFLTSRAKGYKNENFFDEYVAPTIRKMNRVLRAHHVSDRVDGVKKYDFEIEYYIDKYYNITNVLRLDLKSSKNFQEEGRRDDGVYVFEFNDKMNLKSVVCRISRLMIADKNLHFLKNP